MIAAPDTTSDISYAASMPALIESFSIHGLHGYRELSLTSKYAATVLIAKNGSGKTTLMGVLNAFLRGHFHRLVELEFDIIRCKFSTMDHELELRATDLAGLSSVDPASDVGLFARRAEVDMVEFSDFLLSDFSQCRDLHSLEDSSTMVRKIVGACGGYSEGTKRCTALLDARLRSLPTLAGLLQVIKSELAGHEIVYLPTYRRIELTLAEEKETRWSGRRVPRVESRLGISRRSLFSSDINFGLTDIAERLADLNDKIQSASNMGYRKISATIINELLDGSFERDSQKETLLPDKAALLLFFSRIRSREHYRFYGPVLESFEIPDVDKIYRDDNSDPQSDQVKRFLTFFLGKLNTVISATRDIEKMVQEFVTKCNSYFTEIDSEYQSADSKMLELELKNLQVQVINLARDTKIPLDSLSSGEKQIISLFARLYLYEGKKIVLIDEPELSLSIEWQRRILTDILNAPSCRQLIAITHSPFVFDNELTPYAGPLGSVKFAG